jgi:hypothetical protein
MKAPNASEQVMRGAADLINARISMIAPYTHGSAVIQLFEDGPAPAWYSGLTGDIGINLKSIDIKTADELSARFIEADLYDPKSIDDKEIRKLIGIIQHEVAHHRWSPWLMKRDIVRKSTTSQYNVICLFEEIRIEKRAIDSTRGRARPTLRSSFELVLDNVVGSEMTSRAALADAWVLVAGRAYATVASFDEVQAVDDVARTVFGDDVVDQMHELLDEAVTLEISNFHSESFNRMIEIVDEWIDLVGTDSGGASGSGIESTDLNEDEIGSESAGSTTPDAGDEQGTSGNGGGSAGDQDDETPIDGSLGQVGSQGTDELSDTSTWTESLTEEEADLLRRTVAEAAKKVSEAWNVTEKTKIADSASTASEVFKRTKAKPRYVTREPSAQERRAAADLARRIESFNYTAPSVTKVKSLVPPGRLNAREAVRGSADRSRGAMVSAKPWQTKKRKHVHNPPITIGLMTDVSGSMGWAEQTVAATSYVFSKAISRVSGRFAAVTFGNKAEAIIWPNEIVNEVRVRRADGASEDFDHGVAALDGILKLTTGKGVRLLVVVSDGHFVKTSEPSKARQWYDRMAAAGVGIVWVNGYQPTGIVPARAEFAVIESRDVTQMIDPIATAMERAILSARS